MWVLYWKLPFYTTITVLYHNYRFIPQLPFYTTFTALYLLKILNQILKNFETFPPIFHIRQVMTSYRIKLERLGGDKMKIWDKLKNIFHLYHYRELFFLKIK